MDVNGIVDQLLDMATRMRNGEDVGFADDSAAVEIAAAYMPLMAHALWIMLEGKEVVVRATPNKNALAFSAPETGAIMIRRAQPRVGD